MLHLEPESRDYKWNYETFELLQVKSGILSGFLSLDEKLRKIPEVANGEDKSGTTAGVVNDTILVSI